MCVSMPTFAECPRYGVMSHNHVFEVGSLSAKQWLRECLIVVTSRGTWTAHMWCNPRPLAPRHDVSYPGTPLPVTLYGNRRLWRPLIRLDLVMGRGFICLSRTLIELRAMHNSSVHLRLNGLPLTYALQGSMKIHSVSNKDDWRTIVNGPFK